jgi:hypothetical protein
MLISARMSQRRSYEEGDDIDVLSRCESRGVVWQLVMDAAKLALGVVRRRHRIPAIADVARRPADNRPQVMRR